MVRESSYSTLALGAVSLALWLVAVHNADFLRMGKLGLITVLGWPYFVGLALVIIALACEMFRAQLRTIRLVVLLLILVIVLFGTASAVEPVAGLTDSWLMAGFTQYLFQHGHVLLYFDARFSWPGAFSLGSVLIAFAGQSNALGFIRWFPLVIELLYLAPLLVIARFSGVGRRAGWLGVVLFYATNWIYQDYFSPQALNYLFFLTVLATVLACWQPKRSNRVVHLNGVVRRRIAESRAVFTRRRMEGAEAASVWSGDTTVLLLGLLGLLSLASAMSHQLTPYALILALVGLLCTRRLGRPELVVVVALLTVGWLSLGASNFWIGHLTFIFGSVGQIGSNYGANVTNRITGSSSHLLIVEIRILLTAALYMLAGIGVLLRRPNSRSLEVLAGAPFLLLAAQSYGGEGLLRVVLFGLPFTTLLAASAILPEPTVTRRSFFSRPRVTKYIRMARPSIVVVVALSFALATTLVRGGNDAYEAFSTGELAASNFAYLHARPGQTIGMITPFQPIGQQAIGSVQFYFAAGASGGAPVSSYQTDLLKTRPAFVLLSQSQEAWGEIVAGFAKGWEASVEQALLRNGYQIVAHWPTATVLHLGPIA